MISKILNVLYFTFKPERANTMNLSRYVFTDQFIFRLILARVSRPSRKFQKLLNKRCRPKNASLRCAHLHSVGSIFSKMHLEIDCFVKLDSVTFLSACSVGRHDVLRGHEYIFLLLDQVSYGAINLPPKLWNLWTKCHSNDIYLAELFHDAFYIFVSFKEKSRLFVIFYTLATIRSVASVTWVSEVTLTGHSLEPPG